MLVFFTFYNLLLFTRNQRALESQQTDLRNKALRIKKDMRKHTYKTSFNARLGYSTEGYGYLGNFAT